MSRQRLPLTSGQGSFGESGQQLLRDFQIRLVHEDLLRSGGHEILERRIDRLGVAVAAFDARGPEQAAHDLGLGLARHDLQDDCVVGFHVHRLVAGCELDPVHPCEPSSKERKRGRPALGKVESATTRVAAPHQPGARS
jgi:hypothetical protein